MPRPSSRFSDQLRKAIDESGMSRYAICQACGIDKGTMSRFMSRQVGLSLQTLDRLADFLDLRITTGKRRRAKGR